MVQLNFEENTLRNYVHYFLAFYCMEIRCYFFCTVWKGCQTRRLLGATLHVGNRAEGRMMFSIWKSPVLRATVSAM